MGNRVEIELSLNSKGFTAGLTQATSGMKSFASGLGKSMFGQFIGANFFQNAVRSVANFVQTTLKEGERIKNLAEVFGGDTTFAQQLSYDADEAGVSIEKLQATFGKLAKAREQALEGKSDFILAFARFGITLKDIEASDPTALFKAVRATVAGLGEDTKITSDMMADLLRIGFQVAQIPLLKNPSANSAYIDPIDIAKLDEADDLFGKLWNGFKIVAATSISGVYQSLVSLAKWSEGPYGQALLRPFIMIKDIITWPMNALWRGVVGSVPGSSQLTTRGVLDMRYVKVQEEQDRKEKFASAQRDADQKINTELVNKQQAELAVIEEKIEAERISNAEGVKKLALLREQLREQQSILAQSDVAAGDTVGGDTGAMAIAKGNARLRSMQIRKQIRDSVKNMPAEDQQNILENERFRLEQKLKSNLEYQKDIPGLKGMPLEEKRSEYAGVAFDNRLIRAQLDALKFNSGLGDPGVGVMEGIGKAGGLVGGAVTMSNPQLRIGQDQLAVQKDMVVKLQSIVENTTQMNLANEFL